jgi:hypothetical protein
VQTAIANPYEQADGTARSFVFGIEIVASNSTPPIMGIDTRKVQILGLWMCVAGILGSAIIRRRGSPLLTTRGQFVRCYPTKLTE